MQSDSFKGRETYTVYTSVFALVFILIHLNSISCEISACPAGFTPYAEARKCYFLIQFNETYDNQFLECTRLAPGAHLAAPLNRDEDRFIRAMIQASPGRCFFDYHSGGLHPSYYLAGKRIHNNCSEFVWKLFKGRTEEMAYRNFWTGQPDCYENNEFCVHYYQQFTWNDLQCSVKSCAVCEYRLSAITTQGTTSEKTTTFIQTTTLNSACTVKLVIPWPLTVLLFLTSYYMYMCIQQI